jgi:hypothetical protein
MTPYFTSINERYRLELVLLDHLPFNTLIGKPIYEELGGVLNLENNTFVSRELRVVFPMDFHELCNEGLQFQGNPDPPQWSGELADSSNMWYDDVPEVRNGICRRKRQGPTCSCTLGSPNESKRLKEGESEGGANNVTPTTRGSDEGSTRGEWGHEPQQGDEEKKVAAKDDVSEHGRSAECPNARGPSRMRVKEEDEMEGQCEKVMEEASQPDFEMAFGGDTRESAAPRDEQSFASGGNGRHPEPGKGDEEEGGDKMEGCQATGERTGGGLSQQESVISSYGNEANGEESVASLDGEFSTGPAQKSDDEGDGSSMRPFVCMFDVVKEEVLGRYHHEDLSDDESSDDDSSIPDLVPRNEVDSDSEGDVDDN